MELQQSNRVFLVVLLSLLLPGAISEVTYVSQASGNEQVTSIQECVDKLSSPGDACALPPGRFHETVTISGKHGTKERPIVIHGSREEPSVLDGTVPLNVTKWDEISDGIFKATIEQDVWQLFIDGVMMTNARWPNSFWHDKSIFLNRYWGKSSNESKLDEMVDDGSQDLKGSGLNVTGAMAILNIGSFNTFIVPVKGQGIEGDRFTYDASSLGRVHFKAKHNQYFLEDKLDFLDAPGEWFYDKDSKTVYVKTLNGTSPAGSDVRGKVQTYAFTITNCTHVVIRDLTFFATTLHGASISKDNFISDLTIDSLIFKYPSYSRRMLHEPHPPQWTKLITKAGKGKHHVIGTLRIFNNTFYGSDGVALQFYGDDVQLENNLFEYNDWSGTNMVQGTGGMGTVVSRGNKAKFIRNTLRYNGASAGLLVDTNPEVTLNHIERQCWGMIQHDGSGVQARSLPQTNSVMQQNWVHDSPKYGLRFDGEPPKTGRNGTMLRNVVWRCNGMMVKGFDHKVFNNLVFHKYNERGDNDKQGFKCTLCVLRYVRSNPGPINDGTVTIRNVADKANGGYHNDVLYPIAGYAQDNVLEDAKTEVVDAYNMDFRPRAGSRVVAKNAGPYDFNQKKYYWIPGRHEYKASTPVPPDGSTVKPGRDAVMWLNGFGATAHAVYFGTEREAVDKANKSSPEYRRTLKKQRNVFDIRFRIQPNTQYFWRVDAEVSKSVVYKGDVWSFTTPE